MTRPALRGPGPGCSRNTGPRPGGEVAGRVGVTVFPEATALAGKDSLAQRHVLAEPPARRAGLRRGEEPGSHRQGGPVPVGLVSELACQFAPGGVGDRLRQVVVLRHVLHRQVLDADGAVGLGDRARDPVGEVVASVGHPPMEAGQASPCLGPIQSGARAALDATTNGAYPLGLLGESGWAGREIRTPNGSEQWGQRPDTGRRPRGVNRAPQPALPAAFRRLAPPKRRMQVRVATEAVPDCGVRVAPWATPNRHAPDERSTRFPSTQQMKKLP
jgi:hypothetical protein